LRCAAGPSRWRLRAEPSQPGFAHAVACARSPAAPHRGRRCRFADAVACSSLAWPGAVSVCQGKSFANIYVGYGLKQLDKPYSPPQLPAMAAEYGRAVKAPAAADAEEDKGEDAPASVAVPVEQDDPTVDPDAEAKRLAAEEEARLKREEEEAAKAEEAPAEE
jgi:hypothetical protein